MSNVNSITNRHDSCGRDELSRQFPLTWPSRREHLHTAQSPARDDRVRVSLTSDRDQYPSSARPTQLAANSEPTEAAPASNDNENFKDLRTIIRASRRKPAGIGFVPMLKLCFRNTGAFADRHPVRPCRRPKVQKHGALMRHLIAV